MAMKETKDILAELRNIHGLSMLDVAKGADISYSTYSKYEYGTREIGVPAIKKLAQFYGVSSDVIIGIEPIPEPDTEERARIMLGQFLEDYHKFPIEQRLEIIKKMFELIKEKEEKLQKKEITVEKYRKEIETILVEFYPDAVSAGTGVILGDERPEKLPFEATEAAKKAKFAVTVHGDSMTPDYNDGDIVLVREDDVEIGEVGVFRQNGEGYIKERGERELISHNPKYPPIPMSDDCFAVGKVIGKGTIIE